MNGLTAVSLFAGIGGIDRALELAGVNVTAAVEIDPDCRGVLRRHFPGTAIFNDVMEVTGEQLRATGFVPERGVLAGGFPCQGLSVAGRRKGLADARSGLFWHVMRLADELRPRWLLLENVPGLLSSVCPCPGDGTCVAYRRAMACGEWRGDRDTREWFPDVPHNVSGGACPGGCMAAHGGAMGTVLGALGERGYGFAYRVLDAQFFGVPQRRRRVFVVGHLGDPTGPVQVLLEPEGGEGHPATGRATGAGTAGAPGVGAVAALQGGGRRGHRVDAEGAAGGQLVAFDAAQITHPENRANPQPGEPAPPLVSTGQPMVARTFPVALRGRDGGSQIEAGEAGQPAFTVRASTGGSSHAMVAHALTSEGADASEDGTGRGTPLVTVPMAFNPQTGGSKARLGWGSKPTALQANQVTAVAIPVDLRNAARESLAGETAGTGIGDDGDPSFTLSATGRALPGVATNWQGGSNQDQIIGPESTSPTLAHSSAAHSGHHEPKVLTASAVRRLTPTECERLQGFPDGWTDGQSDSARYRQLGNSVAVPCITWITRRIADVDASLVADRGAA